MMNSVQAKAGLLPFTGRIHVLGGGSIGLLFAAKTRIAFPSYPIKMLLRPHHLPKLQQQQQADGSSSGRNKFMQVCLMDRTMKVSKRPRPRNVRVPAEIVSSSDSQSPNKKIQNLVLCTKAYDASTALQSILDRLDDSARIIVLCNGGLAVRDEIQQVLRNHEQQHVTLRLATTTHGSYRESLEPAESDDDDDKTLYHVTHAGYGVTLLEEEPELAQLWDRAGLEAKSISKKRMTMLSWHKLAANCVCNPMTAILGVKNGALLRDDCELYQRLANNVVEELSQLMVTISVKDGALLDDETAAASTPEALMAFVQQVIRDNVHNKSSMWQDVLAKKRTEIDYLNGWAVRKGEEFGVGTPANKELAARISDLTDAFER